MNKYLRNIVGITALAAGSFFGNNALADEAGKKPEAKQLTLSERLKKSNEYVSNLSKRIKKSNEYVSNLEDKKTEEEPEQKQDNVKRAKAPKAKYTGEFEVKIDPTANQARLEGTARGKGKEGRVQLKYVDQKSESSEEDSWTDAEVEGKMSLESIGNMFKKTRGKWSKDVEVSGIIGGRFGDRTGFKIGAGAKTFKEFDGKRMDDWSGKILYQTRENDNSTTATSSDSTTYHDNVVGNIGVSTHSVTDVNTTETSDEIFFELAKRLNKKNKIDASVNSYSTDVDVATSTRTDINVDFEDPRIPDQQRTMNTDSSQNVTVDVMSYQAGWENSGKLKGKDYTNYLYTQITSIDANGDDKTNVTVGDVFNLDVSKEEWAKKMGMKSATLHGSYTMRDEEDAMQITGLTYHVFNGDKILVPSLKVRYDGATDPEFFVEAGSKYFWRADSEHSRDLMVEEQARHEKALQRIRASNLSDDLKREEIEDEKIAYENNMDSFTAYNEAEAKIGMGDGDNWYLKTKYLGRLGIEKILKNPAHRVGARLEYGKQGGEDMHKYGLIYSGNKNRTVFEVEGGHAEENSESGLYIEGLIKTEVGLLDE